MKVDTIINKSYKIEFDQLELQRLFETYYEAGMFWPENSIGQLGKWKKAWEIAEILGWVTEDCWLSGWNDESGHKQKLKELYITSVR